MNNRWTQCVLDASLGANDGLFTFCPIKGDINGEFSVVTGMNYVDALPPKDMSLVAIVHEDGQAAVDAFCQENEKELKELSRALDTQGPETIA